MAHAYRVARVLTILLALIPLPATATLAIDRMERFFSSEATYFAEFQQVIYDEGLHIVEESSGLMWLSRPHRFRWDYVEPAAQTIVGDGDSIWVYDLELEQVTVRNLSEFLDQSAAEILAGSGNVNENYRVEDLGQQGSLAWVNIVPLSEDSLQFESMRLGFDEETLRVLEVLDSLGSLTQIQMVDVILGESHAEKVYQFEVPDGVDVIDSREEE